MAASSEIRVFRPRNYYRNLGLGMFALILPLAGAVAYEFASAGEFNSGGNNGGGNSETRLAEICLFVSIVVFFAGLAIYMLFDWRFERLEVRGERVLQRGVFREREIDLSRLRKLDWGPGGRLRFQTKQYRLNVYLQNFEPADRLWLIEFFRGCVPASAQAGWELFCYRIAMPLREELDSGNEIAPGRVRLTRNRWNWYFGPILCIITPLAAYAAWQCATPSLALSPLIPAGLWMFLRWQTPRQGITCEQIIHRPETMQFLASQAILLLFAVGLVGSQIAIPADNKLPWIAGWAVWIAAFVYLMQRADRRLKERVNRDARLAVLRWDSALSRT